MPHGALPEAVSGPTPTPPRFADEWLAPANGPPASPPSPPRWTRRYLVFATIVVAVVLIVGLGFAGLIPGLDLGPKKVEGGGNPVEQYYILTFLESGLPTGTAWSVTLNGSTQGSAGAPLEFAEANGSYSYQVGNVPGYNATPNSGTLQVAGAAVKLLVVFSLRPAPLNPVRFDQAGLPNGTNWSVTLGGLTAHSTGASIQFLEPNGTYAYSVGPVLGFLPSPSSGYVTVDGAGPTHPVTFSPSVVTGFVLSFYAVGLMAGTDWWVNVSGTLHPSSGSEVTLDEPNGTYGYVADPVPGYTVTPASGSVLVSGSNVTVAIYYGNGTGIPIGSVFALGNPVSGTCSTSQVAARLCATAGDETFAFTIEQSTILLGNVAFLVRTAGDVVLQNNQTGAFALESIVGTEIVDDAIAAGIGLAMTGSWTNYNGTYSPDSPLTTTMSLVIDVGIPATDWTPGQGDTVVGFGLGGYVGTTSAVELP